MVIKATPQILQRVSVRWLPAPAYEDSNTVALNVSGYFLDLRVATADGALQWSRAGERKQIATSPLTFQWTRIIDSTGSSQADDAKFKTLPNGDDLEYGEFNQDGTSVPYEEVWRDVTNEVSVDGDDCAWILQSVDGSTFLGKVGGIYMGMSRTEDGRFGVRKEVCDKTTGSWKIEFESGPVADIPRAMDVIPSEPQLKTMATTPGDKGHALSGHEYVIRGIAIAPWQ